MPTAIETLAAFAASGVKAKTGFTVNVGTEDGIPALKENLESIGPVALLTDPEDMPNHRLVYVEYDKMLPKDRARIFQRLFDTKDFEDKIVVLPLYRVDESDLPLRLRSSHNIPNILLNKLYNLPVA